MSNKSDSRDGIVQGTDKDDLIDENYTGDPDGDMVDNRDAINYGEEGSDDDLILAGDGDDTVHAGRDDDTVFGGEGNDKIFGDGGDNVLVGGPGNDSIYGGDGDDLILGDGPAEPASYGSTEEMLSETADTAEIGTYHDDDDKDDDDKDDDDKDEGTGYDDQLFGGDGDDTILGGKGNDTINGQGGNDLLFGGAGDDVIQGGDGDDTIYGGDGDDWLKGEGDADTFRNVGPGDTIWGGSEGNDYDILDLTGSAGDGSLKVTDLTTDSNGNGFDGTVIYYDEDGKETGRLEFEEIEKIVPCFTPGARIATPQGERLVEDLREGDRVITRDNGIQEIRWVGRKDLGFDEVERAPHMRPVLIRKGALGNDLPERDMLVSPNHRVLVANDRTALLFEEREVLAAAKHLVDDRNIRFADTLGISYIHFMFDHHEVVLSDGAWTESFQPGDYSLGGIGNAQRSEIFELFPELETVEGLEGYSSARRTLKRFEARLLVE